jgi:mannose-1-phosphate guanylyltransferase / mannose-6-phosphate isomerase
VSNLLIQPVVLCGGVGARLWPLSREGFPKQFLILNGTESLFQLSVKRLATMSPDAWSVNPPIVATNDKHRFIALEQLNEIDISEAKLILEPEGRNTAAALTMSALMALDGGDDPVLVVTPADHLIEDLNGFHCTIENAIEQAADGAIVTFGVRPDRPETGYGYISCPNQGHNDLPMRVHRFVEKPNVELAKTYLKSGDYFWNSGIFVLKASVWLDALEKFRPDILSSTKSAWDKRVSDERFTRPGKSEFLAIPDQSIDYAVMEHCPTSDFPTVMLRLDLGWSDLGSWDAVWDGLPKNSDGNSQVGDVLMNQSTNTLVHANSRFVAVLGVSDIVVVETADAVLVVNKSSGQDVKKIVDSLNDAEREEHMLHRKVHRPWGWYDSLDEGSQFKVKRIMVKPMASLSLQKHQHRAEHWVVVSGTAEITCGRKTVILKENQSTYIPLGELHRLANPSDQPLEIIEVQSGKYLGEDDIIRFEDRYGR